MQQAELAPVAFGTIKNISEQLNLASSEVQKQFQLWAKQKYPQINLHSYTSPLALYSLPGPTGESNQYHIVARHRIAVIAAQENGLLNQFNAVMTLNSKVGILAANALALKMIQSMPKSLQQQFFMINDLSTDEFDAVLHQGSTQDLKILQTTIAQRQGAIVGITHLHDANDKISLVPLLIERAISINTAAAGGNASLMTLDQA